MRNKIFCVFVMMIIICIPLSIITRNEKYISIAENRSLFRKSDIRISSFSNDLEKYLTDQFPFGEFVKEKYNFAKNKLVASTTKVIEKSNLLEKIPLGKNLYRLSNSEYIVDQNRKFEENKDKYDVIIDNINEFSQRYSNIDFYVYNIITDSIMDEKDIYNKYILKKLNSRVKFGSSTTINNYEDYKRCFYKTDHHWNYKGQYEGYKDIVDLLNVDDRIRILDTYKFDNYKFYGSRARTLGDYSIHDNFCAYKYNYPQMKVEIDYKEVSDYGHSEDFINGTESLEQGINYYGDYYGLDDGIIKFTNEDNPDGKNILIISNSYSNAVNKIIASDFNNTYVIDLRNYKNELGEEFYVDDFLKENKIDKVLYIGNYYFFTNKKMLLNFK